MRPFICMSIVASVVGLAGCPRTGAGPVEPIPEGELIESVAIAQLDFGAEGSEAYVPASDWGRATVTYRGAGPVLYLNLTIDGGWMVQNLRVHSIEGYDRSQSIAVTFGLGNPRGQRVEQVEYGATLTGAPAEVAPPIQGRLEVVAEPVELSCSGGGEPPPPAGPVVGGAASGRQHRHASFPNQESPRNGCVQAAFSNSLKWLKQNNDKVSGASDADIELGPIGDAVGWTEAGGTPGGFIEKKNDYLAEKGIPVTTTEVGVEDVGKKMDDKCDVEMWTSPASGGVRHLAAVVGISQGADGKYSIDVAHDTRQGQPGGTTTETVTYDPATGTVSGPWFGGDGATVLKFIVECPPSGCSAAPGAGGGALLIVVLAIGLRRRRRTRAGLPPGAGVVHHPA